MKKILLILVSLSILSIISNAQRVGVNAPIPSDALHVVGTAAENPLRVQVGTATKLRVLSNGGTTIGANNTSGTPADGLYVQGNTGLGVGNPTEKLEVSGNVNISGIIKANGVAGQNGQILQANGNGGMVWTNTTVNSELSHSFKYFKHFIQPGLETWTVPAGVTEILVELQGGGGGGDIAFGGGGGGYVRFIRNVTPGEVLSFSVGAGGIGRNGTNEADTGSGGYFPTSTGSTCGPGGGVRGTISGLGGGGNDAGCYQTALNSIIIKGQNGHPSDVDYLQISATNFGTKTTYGAGGLPGGINNLSFGGTGGFLITDITVNTTVLTKAGRNGTLGAGGGGGTAGGAGGDGFVIIHW